MDLNDFLSLIQLAAGLNAAYIVVGISQGYTNILLNKIFNIRQQIQTRFNNIKEAIKLNQETLKSTEPSDVNGKNTIVQIEKVKRRYEILTEKIKVAEQEIENNANIKCEFRCFSGLSLMMFLYCCTLLFVAPFCLGWFLLPFTLLVLIHSIVGWFWEKSKYVCNLMLVIWEYLIVLALSAVGCSLISKYINWEDVPNVWSNMLIITSALLPMVNFVIFFIKSLSKMKSIKENIDAQAASIEQECSAINKDFDKLQSLEALKMDMGK